MFFKTVYNSPLGNITLASDEQNLVGLWFEKQKYFGGKISPNFIEKDNIKILDNTKIWLDRYFSEKKPQISELSLSMIGTEFQKTVWKILCEIPYGEVITYGEIANKVFSKTGKMSAQAVGGAVGRNPISIIIPCHRVIGRNGNLTGYAGGIDKKLELLKLEKVNLTKFFIPA